MKLRLARPAADVVLIGQTGTGKTRLFLELAEQLGGQPLHITMPDGRGGLVQRSLRPEAARTLLVGDTAHLTRSVQWVEIPRQGFATSRLRLIDTGGLSPSIHPEHSVRRAMAEAMEKALTARCTLHLIDAARVGETGCIDTLDQELRQVLSARPGYVLLATQMDRNWAMAGYLKLRGAFMKSLIIPVSSTQRRGLREVRTFVLRTVAAP